MLRQSICNWASQCRKYVGCLIDSGILRKRKWLLFHVEQHSVLLMECLNMILQYQYNFIR